VELDPEAHELHSVPFPKPDVITVFFTKGRGRKKD
jgi:hypothetical protein